MVSFVTTTLSSSRHRITLRVTDPEGRSASDTISIRNDLPPPMRLVALRNTPQGIQLTWTRSRRSDFLAYRVYRRQHYSDSTLVTRVTVNSDTTWLDGNVQLRAFYSYWVVSEGTIGYRERTDQGSVQYSLLGTLLRGYVSDAVLHPTGPVIFACDRQNKLVYKIDGATGDVSDSLQFTLPVVRLASTLENGRAVLYAALRIYDEYGSGGDEGFIAVIDADTFVLERTVHISTDPFDLVADGQGVIYVSSAYGGYQCWLRSYETEGFTSVDQIQAYQSSSLALGPFGDVLYGVGEQYSNGIMAWKVADGRFQSHYEFRDYAHSGGGAMSLSPDGRLLLTASGNVFRTSVDSDSVRVSYSRSLAYGCRSIAFDTERGKAYASAPSSRVVTYDAVTLDFIDSALTDGNPGFLFLIGRQLLVFIDSSYGGQSGIQMIPVP